ncbi:MAG TPA: polysaccharide deacetylase family protein [Usitatibacteraceae bacterium]
MKRFFTSLIFLLLASTAFAAPRAVEARPVELHQSLNMSLAAADTQGKVVALTLDACGGAFDEDLIQFLIRKNIQATIFATKRWIDRNPRGVAMLTAHPDLFEIEDHGANHVPAVIGVGRRVYGIPGEPDVAHLVSEVSGGAEAVAQISGTAPRWYRGATGEYDAAAIDVIKSLGYQIAGFSLNADAGATLSRRAIVARLKSSRHGDIIIAHMNKPNSDTAEGLAEGLSWMLAQGFQFVTLNAMNVHAPV